MNETSKQINAGLTAVVAIGDAIRELGSVPSGELYVRVMGRMSVETYKRIIDALKGAELVSESADVLKWVGPESV